MRIVVMGVAGSGKSTLGRSLADTLGAAYLDADDAHPAANVAKMANGEPLDDEDRWPWLARLRQALRHTGPVVVTCSALKRSYRDMLRQAGDVRFVYLHVDPAVAEQRVDRRAGHFMKASMVDSQFAALEPPGTDETDVLVVDGALPTEALLDAVLLDLHRTRPGLAVEPLLADGDVERAITSAELAEHTARLVDVISRRGARRVLVVPPDQTRLHSRSGEITALLVAGLEAQGCAVGVLPALGTHAPMTDEDAVALFGSGWSAARLLRHDWRFGLRMLGEIRAAEVEVVTDGAYVEPIPVAVDDQLFDGWDLIVSVGQVVPHEVIGMANFTKNVVIGLGGGDTIQRTHFVGAVAGMERIMGRASTPVRDLVDAAFDRFLAPALAVLWVLTVVEDVDGTMVLRGLFVGEGGSTDSGGAAFTAATALAQRTNVTVVEEPLRRVVCWLDPTEFRSTWLGNKAVYRTRMAIADGGELVVLAPGVRRFGEDPEIDRLIRRHGYRGTPSVTVALRTDEHLAGNLGAAAHLVHGSSEGRFRIVLCTDPRNGGLTQQEVESVGYEWRHLSDALSRAGVDGTEPTGWRVDSNGSSFFFVANPGMGLWASAARLSLHPLP